MTQHLLLVSLGPIQDFIASARRCQDLWFGSFLLSELSRATAEAIQEAAGMECLVFPGSLREDRMSVANKIVAVLPAHLVPATVARMGEDAMLARLRGLAEDLFEKVNPAGFHRERAMQQVGEMMEYLWVAAPIEADYASARARAEELLSFRKNTRTWKQARGQPVPKSSLDGQRESVLDESLYERVKNGDLKPEQLRKGYFVQKSERLCGVGLLKRIGEDPSAYQGPRRPAFSSNSDVASRPLMERIRRTPGAHERYLAELGALGVDLRRFHDGQDGYLLFADRLPEVFEMYAGELSEADQKTRVRKAERALQTLFDEVKQKDPPLPYFALLLADGDRMGQAIDRLKARAQHQALSQALEGFARGCKQTVEDHEGSLIYAGGDDVMALLPLHTALDCASRLREDFRQALEQVEALREAPPTLSVGLGVAHHLDSMGEARRLARQAEDLAKQERDSLAIVVDKRSGAQVAVTGSWREGMPLHRRIAQWCRLLHEEKLPDSAAYDLEAAVAPLLIGRPDAATIAALKDVALSLALRVAQRRRAGRGEQALDDGVRGLLEGRFVTSEDPFQAVRALSAELQIARLFQRAHDDADDWHEVNP